MKIGILGAGPAGIFAALKIRNITMTDVCLFDLNPGIGRKLSVTGSGRCNITNLNLKKENYYSLQDADISAVIKRFPPQEIRSVLENEGIPTVSTDDGWVYPVSFSAANVNRILRNNLLTAGVAIHENTKVVAIKKEGSGFLLQCENSPKAFYFDRVIVASGGKAHPQLQADTTILISLKKMGIPALPFSPALAPVELEGKDLRAISGIRLDAGLNLYQNELRIKRSEGNVIFTDFGLNGPGAMNLSHLITPETAAGQSLSIDFLCQEKAAFLEKRYFDTLQSSYFYRNLYLAILPEKVVDFFFAQWKVSGTTAGESISAAQFRKHKNQLENYPAKIRGVKGYQFAQVSAGGIPLSEINLSRMESKEISGLFFAGEILDVIGPCGGYNLHWAISSGLIAGESAALPRE